MRDGRFISIRTDMWREGKWLDLWSVVHLLSGISVGFGLYLLHWAAVAAVVVAVLAFIAYEMWEALMQIKEAPTNRFMDVVVGTVGFLPTFFLVGPMLNDATRMPVFLSVLTMNSVLGAIGWRVSSKANELRKRMRARYAKQKAWLLSHREQLKKRNL